MILNPLKKFWKNAPKKVITKNVTDICTFFPFTYALQTCFACNFFELIFYKFFNEILLFCYIFDWKKKFGGHISFFFRTLKPNAQKTAQKIKKRIL